jgi:hypothetical protein
VGLEGFVDLLRHLAVEQQRGKLCFLRHEGDGGLPGGVREQRQRDA